jgi:hypothetical protein
VRNARIISREHGRQASAKAERAYPEALSAEGVAIRKANAAHFKQAVAYAARG